MGNNVGEGRLPRVLLLYRVMLPSIILCGHSQLCYLQEQEKIEYRSRQEQHLNEADLVWADVVFLGRLDSWYEKQICRALQANGKPLVYIIDDDLLDVPAEMSSAPHYRLPEIQSNIAQIIDMCQVILTPSPRLMEKYAVGGRQGILLEEPAVHCGEYRPHNTSKPVKVGFAGSIDRTRDVENTLGEALMRLRDEYGEAICFSFFGAIPDFARSLGAQVVPFCMDYSDYLDQLEECDWDIGLGPMPETDFHRYKHYIKYIEYSSVSTASVLSDAEPYSRLRRMDAPAVFCKNDPEAWYGAIKSLVDDRDRLEALRRDARDFAVERFRVGETAKPLAKYLERTFATGATGEQPASVPYRIRSKKCLNLIHQAVMFVKKYKWNTPKMLARKIALRSF